MPDPIVAREEVDLAVPRALVYATVADVASMTKWRADVRAVHLAVRGSAREGLTFRVERASGEERWRVTRVDPPHAIEAEVLSEKMGRARVVYGFDEEGARCRVALHAQFEPIGMERWFRGWATKDLAFHLREDLAALRSHVEG